MLPWATILIVLGTPILLRRRIDGASESLVGVALTLMDPAISVPLV